MTNANYLVRKMTRSEVDFAIKQAADQAWNPGIYDAECFFAADPDGFFIGLLNGEPISSLSAVRYGSTFGFMGLYIVKDGYRGQGYGARVAQEGLRHLEGRDVGLDGVVEQEQNYRAAGFSTIYHNARYRGKTVGGGTYAADPRVVELSQVSFEDLQAYDDSVFPASRPEFLKCWIRQPECIALGIVEGGHLAGYTVLRRCYVGYKIGPLFADNEMLAETLVQALNNRLPPETPVFLDVPGEQQNPAATALARRHGMTKVFSTARMYRMATAVEMSLPLDRWFGVTTFELG